MGGIPFDEFYESYFERVARALVVAGADRDQAREASQEAFARALRRYQSFAGVDSVIANPSAKSLAPASRSQACTKP
jgi:DNA-directed RNA polymerase specialized sigma24 family protein